MKNLSMFMLSYFLLTACSSTHFIKNDETSYQELNRKLEGRNATLSLNSGEEISGSIVFVDAELISVDGINVPTANINKITDTNHLIGSVSGAIGGAIVGAGMGFVYDYARNISTPIKYDIWESSVDVSVSTESDAKSAVIGCILGICTGAIIGGLNGPTETFIFSQPATGDTTQVTISASKINPFVGKEISSIAE